jgi:hypothetical protein
MLILSCSLFLKRLLTKQTLSPFKGLVIIALLLILSTGCSQAPLTLQQLPSLLPNLSSNANFQIRVTPSSPAGVYTVAGDTNLPDESRITVAAIRYLRQDEQRLLYLNPNLTYSILAYEDVKVSKGKWQTTPEPLESCTKWSVSRSMATRAVST